MTFQHLQIRTSGGTFGFQGVLHTDRRRPALLAVNGSFPGPDYLHDLPGRFPGANVLFVSLPGMGVPWTSTTGPDMVRGLTEAATLLFRDLPLVVFGASTGNLVALGMQMPNIVRKVSLEPFLSTANLWPFIAWARNYMRRNPNESWAREYLWNVFGIGLDDLENRDYSSLVDRIDVPTDVVTGTVPLLPQRRLSVWPSLCSQEARALLSAHPLVTMHEGPAGSGHNTGDAGHEQVLGLMLAGLREASAKCL
jgi:hypothetical protein